MSSQLKAAPARAAQIELEKNTTSSVLCSPVVSQGSGVLTKPPASWRFVPIAKGKKSPIGEGWENSPLTWEEAIAKIGKKISYTSTKEKTKGKTITLLCGGVGVLSGEHSGGLLQVDLDGASAYDLIKTWGELPETWSVKSGRPNREQLSFRVPKVFWEAIATRKFSTGVIGDDGKPEQVELRWNGCQSIVKGINPISNMEYRWELPTEEPAEAPLWLIEKMLKPEHEHRPEAPRQGKGQPAPQQWTDRDWALSYLGSIPPAEDYDPWITVGQALHSVSEDLLSVWDEWSSGASNYKPGVCAEKWGSFGKRTGRSIGTLGFLAKQNGWRSPFSSPQSKTIPPGANPNTGNDEGDRPAAEVVIPHTEVVRERLYSQNAWISVSGKLYEWIGTHYAERPDSLELRRIGEFLKGYKTTSRGKAGFFHANSTAAENALRWVKLQCAVDPKNVNPTGALNLQNGVLIIDWSGTLPSWKLHPHDPEQWIFTYCGQYEYRPDATKDACDRLLAVLEPLDREIFLRLLAAALDLPEVRKRKGRIIRTALLVGAGNNGKDSLRECASILFGGVGLTGCSLQDFSQYDGGRKFPLASLEYSRINWSSENARISIDRLQCLKQVITGDPLDIERKGQDAYSINPACVLFFNVNDTPKIEATSEAIASRIVILPFKKTFVAHPNPERGELPADSRFKYDPAWVKKEVLPALLNRVLLGLKTLIAEGIDYAHAEKTIAEVARQNSHLLQFCEDAGLHYSPGQYVEVKKIWTQLELWYGDNGYLESNGDEKFAKRIWSDPPPGDRLVKAANQVKARFLALFPRCRAGVKPRDTGEGKPIPIIQDLAFAPAMPPTTPKRE